MDRSLAYKRLTAVPGFDAGRLIRVSRFESIDAAEERVSIVVFDSNTDPDDLVSLVGDDNPDRVTFSLSIIELAAVATASGSGGTYTTYIGENLSAGGITATNERTAYTVGQNG